MIFVKSISKSAKFLLHLFVQTHHFMLIITWSCIYSHQFVILLAQIVLIKEL